MQVQVEVNLRSGLDQAARTLRKNIAVLAERVFVEEEADGIFRFVLDHVRRRVVDDLEAVRLRLGFHGGDIHVFGESGIDVGVVELVRTVGAQLVGLGQGDDHVGLADVPLVHIAEDTRGRHVCRIAGRRALIDPAGDDPDLGVGQRWIVLELVDADVPVDVPRRHLARGHLLFDRPRPGPGVLVGHQRHRRDRAGAMTVLTGFLQDGRDVLAERHRRGLLRKRRGSEGADDDERESRAFHVSSRSG